MKQNPGNRSCCAHYASRYLPLTENWIYRLIINHQQYKPIFLSRKKENLSRFPMTDLYSLDDFGLVRQYLELFYFKITGYFPFQLRACDQNHVELLHVHFGYHGAKLIGLKKRLSIPMVCSFYGDDAFASMHAGKYDTLFKVADKILVLGPYMKSELIRLGCTEDKLLIHHLGIDVDKLKFVKRTVKKGSRLRFLIASSFLPKKGVDLAIKALSACKDEFDFSVDVIGDGPLKTEILKRIEAGGMQNRVTLHGYQSYEYFINLAYQCDVFIQASRTTEDNRKEGTPMAIVDAMATGLAVISTKHSDIPEIVKDNINGYLAEENSIESLEECIQKIFDAPEVIEQFSQAGRQWVEKEFNATLQAARLEKIYEGLIAKP